MNACYLGNQIYLGNKIVISIIYTANRFLVVGGYLASSSLPSTEVIDLANSSLSCDSFGELETARSYSVGGVLENTPIVCGGYSSLISQTCLIFGQSQSVTMTEVRYGAASDVLNTTTMWVMGGYWSGNYLKSTEFITLETSVSGPSLPYKIGFACVVKFNESQIYLIGGYYKDWSDNSHFVYIFNPLDNFSYKRGPDMNYRRQFHGCAVMHDGDTTVIVSAGGKGRLYTRVIC